jgi:aconitate hydratase
MGILPLEFLPGQSRASLGLSGRETFTVRGLANLVPRQEVDVEVGREDRSPTTFRARVRIDGAAELDSFRNLGILRMVLRQRLEAED